MTPMLEGLRSDRNFKSFFETALGRHSIGPFGNRKRLVML
ncbi:hypothetical protein ACPOL_4488 [Acidisarcina polymorpha]|uniref:Uncharacterized protein n=1 Tax=Acidisarcina polymorpha TaxID=2211140 RepID=A0A2Z5G410_9BACT|nr:hypothetical protein ACPOL_4488 [Acidisarcina polymorpha]